MTYLNIYNDIWYEMNSMAKVEFYGRFMRAILGVSFLKASSPRQQRIPARLEHMIPDNYEFL